MNELSADKRRDVKRMLSAGMSLRQIAAEVGCVKNTVLRYARLYLVHRRCPCGQDATHRGWCSWRLQFSYRRREWLKRQWGKGNDSGPLAGAIDSAASQAREHGHELGRFVWTSDQSGSLAYSRCQRCGLPVRVMDSESLSGTALRKRCLTAEEQARLTTNRQQQRKDKQSWREGKELLRTVTGLLRHPERLRDVRDERSRAVSRSRSGASRPEPTSRA